MTIDSENLPPDMNRLRWQCRRGMLELDEILLRYLEKRFAQSSAQQQAEFRALLDVEDPVLNDWLLRGAGAIDPDLQAIVRRVRAAMVLPDHATS